MIALRTPGDGSWHLQKTKLKWNRNTVPNKHITFQDILGAFLFLIVQRTILHVPRGQIRPRVSRKRERNNN